MNKQKAVEFLIKAFQDTYGDKVVDLVSAQIEQAKAMEKQQIMDAYKHELDNSSGAKILAEQYYNETYGK